MAKILDINVEPRERSGTGAVKRLRKAGSIPAVIYGRKIAASTLKLDAKNFNRILHESASDNILVNLKIAGEAADQLALVQEVQHDYLKGGVLHVDFHAVAADELIHASVPVTLSGVEAAEKKGGMLEHILHNLGVNCLPKDLPESLHYDVSVLNVGDALHIRDLNLPEGVTSRLDGDVVVAVLKEPTVSEEPVAAAAPAKDAKAAAPAAKGAAPAAKAAAPAAKAPAKK
jgi:large subunit ribosomal protein L25